MKRTLEPMAAFFNARASKYDEVHTGHISGGAATKDLIAQYLPDDTRDILDLGCGTGLELPAIFARFPQAKVTGIDLAGDMLALLRERCAGLAVETLYMSYFDYDFPEARFDAVISVMSLHHFTPAQKLDLFGKVRSTLKPGGVFLNCDYIIDSPVLAHLNFLRLRRLKHEPGEMHFDTPLTARQEIKILRQAGFGQAEIVWKEKNTKVVCAHTL